MTLGEETMPILSRKDWTGYLVELFVVVLGILIAFQVEEWRERLAESRELSAALVRLEDETTTNLAICVNQVPLTASMANSAHLVLKSLSSGRLAAEDVELFDTGLAMMGWNPRPPFLSTVAEEMISTGLLKKLEDVRLRARIAALPRQILSVTGDLAARGSNLQGAVDEISRAVEFDYTGTTDLAQFRAGLPIFEQGITVKYDFEALARNTYLKNLVIEATDTHSDRYVTVSDLCEALTEIGDLLSETRTP